MSTADRHNAKYTRILIEIMNKNTKSVFLYVIIALLLFLPASMAAQHSGDAGTVDATASTQMVSLQVNDTLTQVYTFGVPSGAILLGQYTGNLNVLVTFGLQNESALNQYLSALSNQLSPDYHHYLSRQQFTDSYGPSSSFYASALNYFSSRMPDTHGFGDRISVSITGSASALDNLFHTSILMYEYGNQTLYAATGAYLPQWIASHTSQVAGLQDFNRPHLLPLNQNNLGLLQPSMIRYSNSYPVPVNGSAFLPSLSNQTIQWLYGSDLQAAYNEQPLLNVTYATHQVIATILWAGTNAAGGNVGPFVPSDISAYFNMTIPAGEPHAMVHGVPILGAAPPGKSAANDTSGANLESTLDMEMTGSLAPGANVYEVYGPSQPGGLVSNAAIDSALAYILNPNATYSTLNNVSAISNSYSGSEYNDSAWYEYLQEAQARGISVLASSGDTGNDPTSPDYALLLNTNGTADDLGTPAAQSYNNFGVTAVGGTTILLNTNRNSNDFLHITNDTAWYWNAVEGTTLGYAGAGGSQGGISQVFPEPSWQLNTEANSVLKGQGRGVPDIAAIANNTLIYITTTLEGSGIDSFTGFSTVAGTSIASPVEAGIVAEMNAFLHHEGKQNMGFLNPLVYHLANLQVQKLSGTTTYSYTHSGRYNSSLPVLPMMVITKGHNFQYPTNYGYDLVTGFGSIDTTNFTSYLLTSPLNRNPNMLSGVENSITLHSLDATTYTYDSSTGTYSAYARYNASLDQNFYVADTFGTPIYFINNMLNLKNLPGGKLVMNLTTTATSPFSGLFSTGTVSLTSELMPIDLSLPGSITVTSSLESFAGIASQALVVQVNGFSLQIPLPDASFIIGSMNYSYSYHGSTYQNGPFGEQGYTGGFAPQFGFTGPVAGGTTVFSGKAVGTAASTVKVYGTQTLITVSGNAFGLSASRLSGVAYNLQWVDHNGTWHISVSGGSSEQGIEF